MTMTAFFAVSCVVCEGLKRLEMSDYGLILMASNNFRTMKFRLENMYYAINVYVIYR